MWQEIIFTPQCRFLPPILHYCSHTDPQQWATYVKAPTMGRLYVGPIHGSSTCKPQRWVNYTLHDICTVTILSWKSDTLLTTRRHVSLQEDTCYIMDPQWAPQQWKGGSARYTPRLMYTHTCTYINYTDIGVHLSRRTYTYISIHSHC